MYIIHRPNFHTQLYSAKILFVYVFSMLKSPTILNYGFPFIFCIRKVVHISFSQAMLQTQCLPSLQIYMLKPNSPCDGIWMGPLRSNQSGGQRPHQWNGINAFMKEAQESPSLPCHCAHRAKKAAACETGCGLSPHTKSAGALILDFPASEL